MSAEAMTLTDLWCVMSGASVTAPLRQARGYLPIITAP